MSYSRWIESNWYVYPHVDGWIECDFAGGPFLRWKPEMSYDEFKDIVREEITNVTERHELYSILEENMDDIKHFFDEWKKEKEQNNA